MMAPLQHTYSSRPLFLVLVFFLAINSFGHFAWGQDADQVVGGVPAEESQLFLIGEVGGANMVGVPMMQTEIIKSAGVGGGSNLSVAPPANDNCSAGLGAAYTLFPGAACKNGTFKGNNPQPYATVETGETFGCMAGPPTKSVWYNFIATGTDMWVAVKQTSTPIVCGSNFGLRVYSYAGTCPPPTGAQVGCKAYTTYSAGQIYNILNLSGLTIGLTYMVQVAQNPACGYYDFCIMLGIPSVCNTCSNVCGPICTFAGPTQPVPSTVTSNCTGYPYSPPLNQNDSRTSCFTFTAPNDSISLQQVVSSYCNPNTYSFTYNLYNSSCGLIQSGNVFSNNTITGLTPGVNYRICYSLTAACTWEGQYYPYLYTTATVLPVELLFFEAYAKDKAVELYWASGTELNSQEYIVEKTLNGKEYTEVARVKAAGNSSTTTKYRAIDKVPSVGLSYYRLKQVDQDGKFVYSKLIPARFLSSAISAELFPNPLVDLTNLKFTVDRDELLDIVISDVKGRVVMHQNFNAEQGLNLIPLDLSTHPTGYYMVRIISAEETTTLKLLKK